METDIEDARHEGLCDETPAGEVHDGRGQRLDAQLGVERLPKEVESHNASQILVSFKMPREKPEQPGRSQTDRAETDEKQRVLIFFFQHYLFD